MTLTLDQRVVLAEVKEICRSKWRGGYATASEVRFDRRSYTTTDTQKALRVLRELEALGLVESWQPGKRLWHWRPALRAVK